ncbi:unnamed protein product [Rhizophagus irregularis]|uniref:Uncharacterized protein n=1 Tax=Rhizophagus irregularis TaxID=588596 RepID=A0A2I1G598_9GLOM|nr:hypothetical protein RhiirA4_539896 [Rhizophagus irregularis]CAB4428892.1 unnamed protein product [Rhizophagus irregularis]
MATEPSNEDSMVYLYNNHSYCDWRVTLSCDDGQLYKLLYTINLSLSGFIAMTCIILLWFRISRQGCTLFSPKVPGTGFIRPNPVEGFLVWAILWLIGRISFILILWSGKLKGNYFALETFQELYWTCASTGCAWFVIGTYLQIGNHLNSKQRPWRPNNKLSDGYLLIMTIIVPMTVWPVTAISGYFRDKNNAKIADTLITIRYLLWSLWFGFGAMGSFYFGKELCNILSYHITVAKESNHITVGRVERMQSGLKKIRFTLYIIMLTYLYYFTYCTTASIFRKWLVTHSKSLNIVMFVTYAFFNPLCILFVVATISIRIIQSCRRESSTTILINNNNIINNINANNNSPHIKRISNTSTHLVPINDNSRKFRPVSGLAQEIPELDSITSAIAHMDQHQFDDLVAYTQFNTNNNAKRDVEEIEKNESGSGSGSESESEYEYEYELIEEKSIGQLERVVVRPASPTIPIFSTSPK